MLASKPIILDHKTMANCSKLRVALVPLLAIWQKHIPYLVVPMRQEVETRGKPTPPPSLLHACGRLQTGTRMAEWQIQRLKPGAQLRLTEAPNRLGHLGAEQFLENGLDLANLWVHRCNNKKSTKRWKNGEIHKRHFLEQYSRLSSNISFENPPI